MEIKKKSVFDKIIELIKSQKGMQTVIIVVVLLAVVFCIYLRWTLEKTIREILPRTRLRLRSLKILWKPGWEKYFPVLTAPVR
jgi:hypothetical protein